MLCPIGLVLGLNVAPPDLPKGTASTISPGQPTPGQLNLLRPSIALTRGAGILTSFPSTTHFCLALGADSPCADERCAGNLGLSASGPFTRFIATHVSIRTSDTSSRVHTPPSTAYGTLSYHQHTPFTSLLHPLHCRTTRLDFKCGLWSRPRAHARLTWRTAK